MTWSSIRTWQGSPFFVVQGKGKAFCEALREAADATCSFSRAWRLGLTRSDVFYVRPNQVTKETNTGEFITKGAFVIRGKDNVP